MWNERKRKQKEKDERLNKFSLVGFWHADGSHDEKRSCLS